MHVTCPQCAVSYLLPERLLGPGGARVRCPRCGEVFTVAAEDGSTPSVGAAESPPGEAPPIAANGAAEALLAELESRHGAPLQDAIARGVLFAEFGTALMDAYDEYVRRTGPGASAAQFRSALRERWGVDLAPALPGRETG
jgi:predicted Zn finger-like uncharacterized protein